MPGMAEVGISKTPLESKIFETPPRKFLKYSPSKIRREAPALNWI